MNLSVETITGPASIFLVKPQWIKKGVIVMLKLPFHKHVALLLVLTMLFSLFSGVASANNINADSNNSQQAARASNEKGKLAIPDRKAEVVFLDRATGETFASTIYLTPKTNLSEASFKDLASNYKIVSVKVDKLSHKEQEEIGILWVDTIFDIGNFTLSYYQYQQNPSLWNTFWLVMDGAAVVFPGIPSVSSVKYMIEGSSKLKTALRYSVKKYGQLTGTLPTGWEAHHIFEKRFASTFGTTEYSMLAIAMQSADHTTFTSKMRSKIPYYGESYYKSLGANYIIDRHIDAYREMYYATGDRYWEFLWRFSETRQHTAH